MMTRQALKEWRAKTRQDFPDRRAWLQHIATGPDNRSDVEAARRLLAKPRYNVMRPQNNPPRPQTLFEFCVDNHRNDMRYIL